MLLIPVKIVLGNCPNVQLFWAIWLNPSSGLDPDRGRRERDWEIKDPLGRASCARETWLQLIS